MQWPWPRCVLVMRSVSRSASQTPTAIASMPMYGCTEPRISFSSKSAMQRISNARIVTMRRYISSSARGRQAGRGGGATSAPPR